MRILRACLPPPGRPATSALTWGLAILGRRACARGMAASEAKGRWGLSDACLRSLPSVEARCQASSLVANPAIKTCQAVLIFSGCRSG